MALLWFRVARREQFMCMKCLMHTVIYSVSGLLLLMQEILLMQGILLIL